MDLLLFILALCAFWLMRQERQREQEDKRFDMERGRYGKG